MIRATERDSVALKQLGGWQPLPLDRDGAPEKGRWSVRKQRMLKAKRLFASSGVAHPAARQPPCL